MDGYWYGVVSGFCFALALVLAYGLYRFKKVMREMNDE